MQVSKRTAERRYPRAASEPPGQAAEQRSVDAPLPSASEAAAARSDKELLQLHAEYCKVVANEHRLAILYALAEGERSVGELADEFDLTMANASQHLRVMKARGLVTARRDGRTVYYAVANPKIIAACHLIREALVEQHLANEAIVRGEEKS